MKSKIKYKSIWRNKALFVFLLPGLLGVCIFVLLPFFDVIRRSATTAVTGEFIGTLNYSTIFANKAFQLAVKNTIAFVVICIPLLMVMALGVAMLLSKVKHVQFLKSAFLFPMAVSAASVVLIWKMLFHKEGMFNGLLESLGGVSVDFMGTSMAFWILIISYIWKNLGYTIILWLAGILSVSEAIIEAAKVDGAGAWRCFLYIYLPNLMPACYTIAVLSFVNSFKVFREAYLVAGSYPHESMYLLQHLFNNWFLKLELDKMAAAAVCMALILTVFIVALQIWGRKEEEF